MYTLIGSSLSGLWLLSLSVQDFKTKTVSVAVLFWGSLIPILQGIWQFGEDPFGRIEGLLIGILFLGISKLTAEGIAYADSWVITVLGFYLGIWKLVWLLSAMWMVLLPAAMYQVVHYRYSRRKSLPMIPFLTVAYFLLCLSRRKEFFV